MSFDKAEHTAGLLYKIKFFIVYGKMLFLFLCKIAIWAHDAALNSSRDKPFDLSQEVEPRVVIWSLKIQLCIQLFIDIWEIILYL